MLVADASRRTTRVNAYVSGSAGPAGWSSTTPCWPPPGPGRRTGRAAGTDEVALVVAHELAHVRHRDVLWGTVGAAALAAVAVLAAVALFDLGRSSGPSG